jgi:hypothetical protein
MEVELDSSDPSVADDAEAKLGEKCGQLRDKNEGDSLAVEKIGMVPVHQLAGDPP